MPAITIQSIELTEEQNDILADKYLSGFFAGYTLDNAATGGKRFSKNPPKGIIAKFSQKKD